MLTIWGRPNSVNVQKVLWCCEEIGLRTSASMPAARSASWHAEYRKLNPNGLVPTIEDDGFVLWESHAIVRYLAAKHPSGSLWPDDPEVRALADQWMDWTATTLWPALRPLFLGLIRTPVDKRDPLVLEAARRSSAAQLAIVDGHLESRAFLAGKHSPSAISRSAAASGAGWRCPSNAHRCRTCSAGSTRWHSGRRSGRS
jgi:glutathione S-transferase